MTPTVFATADELIAHLRMLATIPSAESDKFTELDHGLQTAAWCERWAPGDVELHVAALVHDLAHPWDGPGQPRHALMGAEAVRTLLGARVADLVAGRTGAAGSLAVALVAIGAVRGAARWATDLSATAATAAARRRRTTGCRSCRSCSSARGRSRG